MELYFVRHGQTDWNKVHKLQGTTDIPLNEYGESLAVQTGAGLQDVKFDLCITSPLTRTKQTAGLVLGERQIPVITDARIIEMAFGEWEGKHIDPSMGELPESFQNFFHAPEIYEPTAGGENFQNVKDRTGAFLTDLYSNQEYMDKTILVSTHGAALGGILRNIKNAPVSQYWKVGIHKNCAVTRVHVEDARPEIIYENQVFYE